MKKYLKKNVFLKVKQQLKIKNVSLGIEIHIFFQLLFCLEIHILFQYKILDKKESVSQGKIKGEIISSEINGKKDSEIACFILSIIYNGEKNM